MVLPIVGAAISGAGLLLGLGSAAMAGRATQKTTRAIRKARDINIRNVNEQAQMASSITTRNFGYAHGSIRAAAAGSGISVGSASLQLALDINANERSRELTAIEFTREGQIESIRAQAQIDIQQAKAARDASFGSALGSFVGGVGKIFSAF